MQLMRKAKKKKKKTYSRILLSASGEAKLAKTIPMILNDIAAYSQTEKANYIPHICLEELAMHAYKKLSSSQRKDVAA